MTDDAVTPEEDLPPPEMPGAAPGKALSSAAKRALEEANARRAAETSSDMPKEVNGRDGPEPTRYGDWERRGTTTDF